MEFEQGSMIQHNSICDKWAFRFLFSKEKNTKNNNINKS